MPKPRRPKPYQIELRPGLRHACAQADWARLVEAGLAVPILNGAGVPSRRLAHLALPPGLVAVALRGRLWILDTRGDRRPLPTNAARVDRQWVFSNDGASTLPAGLVREVRSHFGPDRWPEADAALREMTLARRQALILDQYQD